MIGIIPYGGVSFATNEMLKKHWIKKYGKGPNTLEKLFIGGIAGLSGQAASHPLDVVRRRMQTPTGKVINLESDILTSSATQFFKWSYKISHPPGL